MHRHTCVLSPVITTLITMFTMPTTSQLSQQGFFMLQAPVAAQAHNQNKLSTALEVNVPNLFFDGQRCVRGNGKGTKKPWDVNSSTFHCHQAPPQSLAHHQAMTFTSSHHGMLIPQTPSSSSHFGFEESIHDYSYSFPEERSCYHDNAPPPPYVAIFLTCLVSEYSHSSNSSTGTPVPPSLCLFSMPDSPHNTELASSTTDSHHSIHIEHDPDLNWPSHKFGGPLMQDPHALHQNSAYLSSKAVSTPDPLLSLIALDLQMTVFYEPGYAHTVNVIPDNKENHNYYLLNPYKVLHACAKTKSATTIAQSMLELFRNAKLTPLEFITSLFNDSMDKFVTFRDAFYKEHHSHRLHNFLNILWKSEKGSKYLKDWMCPHAIDFTCDAVHNEMDAAKPKLYMSTTEVTPDFISTWDINSLMEPIASDTTPIWSCILEAATKTCVTKGKSRSANPRNC